MISSDYVPGMFKRAMAVESSALDEVPAHGMLVSRTLGDGTFHLVSVLVLFAIPVVAASESEGQGDVVAFFKRAVQSPQNIKSFTGSMRTLRERLPARVIPAGMINTAPKLQTFEGAKAGQDFYLKNIEASVINGRSGSNSYTVSSDAISYGVEPFEFGDPNSSDRISQASASAFGFVNQFLQMGFGDLRPETVAWTDNELMGLDDRGNRVFGLLEVSNNLPWRLTVSWGKNAAPLKSIYYAYPSPIWALNGFPAKTTIFVLFEDGLRPFLELSLSEIDLAETELPRGFFDPAKFCTGNTVVTNIYWRDKVAAFTPRGRTTVSLGSIVEGVDSSSAKAPRLVIWCCFLVMTLIPVFVFVANKRKQIRTNH